MSSSLPLLYSPLNPFILSTHLSFPIFLQFSSPTPLVLSISLSYIILYSYFSFFSLSLSFSLSLFRHLFTYLSPLLSPPLSPTFTSYTLHSISFSFYNFFSLTLSPLPFTSPLMSAQSLSSFIAFPADLIKCPSVVLHDFGLSEFTCEDSDIIRVLGWLIE